MSEQRRNKGNKLQRAVRTRSTIIGTANRPRLSIHISNQHVSAQLIDDAAMKTIASASTVTLKDLDKLTMTQKAEKVGVLIAKNAKSVKISKVVFDRGSKKYHGRIKALADAARQEGLEF